MFSGDVSAPGAGAGSAEDPSLLAGDKAPTESFMNLRRNVASQDAINAGVDCCKTACNKKLRKYAMLLGSMARDGIAFRPLIWSAEGRPHPVVDRVIGFASELASRKHADSNAQQFTQRWRREITVALQKRFARMVLACMPAPIG